MKFKDIDWGNDSAEKDPNLLRYFFDHPAMADLKKRNKTFLIGRKGAGKSALRKKYIDLSKSWEDNYIVEITPRFNMFSNIIADKEIRENFNEEIFFQFVWLKLIYEKALVQIGQTPRNRFAEEFDYAEKLAKDSGLKDKNILESTTDLLSRIKVKAGKLGELGLEVEKILKNKSNITIYENEIKKICEAGFKITWIIDDLDLGWNNSKVANNLLLGLLACTNHLKSISTNLHLFICLREDVYSLLLSQTQHSDKYRDVIPIQWTFGDLKQLLEERIRFNYRENNMDIPNNPFLAVFPEKVGVPLINKWLYERTLGRPRELLQLSRLYTENNFNNMPDGEVLKKVESKYSNWKLEDLATEYSNQYPNLSEIFKFWKANYYRHKYHLKYSEFEDMFLDIVENVNISSDWYLEIVNDIDPRKMLRIFYDIGFIGDFLQGGAGGSKTIYSHSEEHEPSFNEFQIHPCFRKAIGTVDRIRTRKRKK